MQPSSEQASYDNGIPIMYCMDQPWFLTNALQLPLSGHADREVMTRASGDYIPGDNRGQWAVGKTAILSWSLSVFPYKVRWVVQSMVRAESKTIHRACHQCTHDAITKFLQYAALSACDTFLR